VENLDFSRPCPDDFVAIFPRIKENQHSYDFRAVAASRSPEDLIAACDLAYCLHWAIVQRSLDGQRAIGKVPPYVIMERRRALEWILSREHWDEVSLDT
jgi:hypothetical protein